MIGSGLFLKFRPETRRSTLLTMPGMSTKLRHCWQRLPTSLSRAMVPTSVHCVVLLPPEGWELQSTTRAGRPEQLLELQCSESYVTGVGVLLCREICWTGYKSGLPPPRDWRAVGVSVVAECYGKQLAGVCAASGWCLFGKQWHRRALWCCRMISGTMHKLPLLRNTGKLAWVHWLVPTWLPLPTLASWIPVPCAEVLVGTLTVPASATLRFCLEAERAFA